MDLDLTNQIITKYHLFGNENTTSVNSMVSSSDYTFFGVDTAENNLTISRTENQYLGDISNRTIHEIQINMTIQGDLGSLLVKLPSNDNIEHYKGSETFREAPTDTPYWDIESEVQGSNKVVDLINNHKKVLEIESINRDYRCSKIFDSASPTQGVQIVEFWLAMEVVEQQNSGNMIGFSISDESGVNVISLFWAECGTNAVGPPGWRVRYNVGNESLSQTQVTFGLDDLGDMQWEHIRFEINYDQDQFAIYINNMLDPIYSKDNFEGFGPIKSYSTSNAFFYPERWWIDSLSWTWDQHYEAGDLLEYDVIIVPNLPLIYLYGQFFTSGEKIIHLLFILLSIIIGVGIISQIQTTYTQYRWKKLVTNNPQAWISTNLTSQSKQFEDYQEYLTFKEHHLSPGEHQRIKKYIVQHHEQSTWDPNTMSDEEFLKLYVRRKRKR